MAAHEPELNPEPWTNSTGGSVMRAQPDAIVGPPVDPDEQDAVRTSVTNTQALCTVASSGCLNDRVASLARPIARLGDRCGCEFAHSLFRLGVRMARGMIA